MQGYELHLKPFKTKTIICGIIIDENVFFCILSVKLNQTPAGKSQRRNVGMCCISEENPKECQISGSKWFARSNKVEAEGSQCSRDAHCVGARSLFWVVCTVHCTDCALCIAQTVHCALHRFWTVPLLNAQVMQCNYSVDFAENTYTMLHWFGWSMK